MQPERDTILTLRRIVSDMKSVYRRDDPRLIPNYTLPEAAHYLRIPIGTLRSWVRGRKYPTQSGLRFFRPIICVPDMDRPLLLSFINLVEAHVLDAIRRKHDIALPKVRKAIQFLSRHFDPRHPLADVALETDGQNLFIENIGALINISSEGQIAMREMLKAHLKRVERDVGGIPVRLYPFTRKQEPNEPRLVVINPSVAFGRPVIFGTGIPTAVIAERWKAGESFESLMDDYGLEKEKIEEAIRCEFEIKAA